MNITDKITTNNNPFIPVIENQTDPVYGIFEKSKQADLEFGSLYTRIIHKIETLSKTDSTSNADLLSLAKDLKTSIETITFSEQDYIKDSMAKLAEIEKALVHLEHICNGNYHPQFFLPVLLAIKEGKHFDPRSFMIDFPSDHFELQNQLEELYQESAPVEVVQKQASTMTSFGKTFNLPQLPPSFLNKPAKEAAPMSDSKQKTLLSEEERSQISALINYLKTVEEKFNTSFLSSDESVLSATPKTTAQELRSGLEEIKKLCMANGWIDKTTISNAEFSDEETASRSTNSSQASGRETPNYLEDLSSKFLELQQRTGNLSSEKALAKRNNAKDFLVSLQTEFLSSLQQQQQDLELTLNSFYEQKQKCSTTLQKAEKAIVETPLKSDPTPSPVIEPIAPNNPTAHPIPPQKTDIEKTAASFNSFTNTMFNKFRATQASVSAAVSNATKTLPFSLESAIESAKINFEKEKKQLNLTEDRILHCEVTLQALSIFLINPQMKSELSKFQEKLNRAKTLFSSRFPTVTSKPTLESAVLTLKSNLLSCNELLKDIEGVLLEAASSLNDFESLDPSKSKLQAYNEQIDALKEQINLTPDRFENIRNVINHRDPEALKDLSSRLLQTFRLFKEGGSPTVIVTSNTDVDSLFQTKKRKLFESYQEILSIEKTLHPQFLELVPEIEATCASLIITVRALCEDLALFLGTNLSSIDEETALPFHAKLFTLNTLLTDLSVIQNEDSKNLQKFTNYEQKKKEAGKTIQEIELSVQNLKKEHAKKMEEDEAIGQIQSLSNYYELNDDTVV